MENNMNEKDLRLGNTVNHHGQEYTVRAIGKGNATIAIEGYKSERVSIKSISPIPLTKEWLVKFGFDKKGHREGLSIILENTLGYKNGRTYFKSWCILESQPKHVHQLQNLYFALTGQEL
jgi:hypothetical protein